MSKIKEYVRHLAVVAMATLAAQCAWAEGGLNHAWTEVAKDTDYGAIIRSTSSGGFVYAGNKIGITGTISLAESETTEATIVEFTGDNALSLKTTSEGKYQLKVWNGSVTKFEVTSENVASSGDHRFSIMLRRGSGTGGHVISVLVYLDGERLFKVGDGSTSCGTGPFRDIKFGKSGSANVVSGSIWTTADAAGTASDAADATSMEQIEADSKLLYANDAAVTGEAQGTVDFSKINWSSPISETSLATLKLTGDATIALDMAKPVKVDVVKADGVESATLMLIAKSAIWMPDTIASGITCEGVEINSSTAESVRTSDLTIPTGMTIMLNGVTVGKVVANGNLVVKGSVTTGAASSYAAGSVTTVKSNANFAMGTSEKGISGRMVVESGAEATISRQDGVNWSGSPAFDIAGTLNLTKRQSVPNGATMTLRNGAKIVGSSKSNQGDWEYIGNNGTLTIENGATATIDGVIGIRAADHKVTISGNNSSVLNLNHSKVELGKIVLANGVTLNLTEGADAGVISGTGKVDGNGVVATEGVASITAASTWTGKYTIKNVSSTPQGGFNPNNFGNANSTLALNNVKVWLTSNQTYNPTIELTDGVGEEGAILPGLWIFDISEHNYTFAKVAGTGTFKLDSTEKSYGPDRNSMFWIKDLSSFAGNIEVATQRLYLGLDTTVSRDKAKDGKVVIMKNEAVVMAEGKALTAKGIILSEGATLKVNAPYSEDIVESGVSGKIVKFDEATKTYSLTDPAPAEITFTLTTLPEHAVAYIQINNGETMPIEGGTFTATPGDQFVVWFTPAEGYVGKTLSTGVVTVVYPMQTTEIQSPTAELMNIRPVVAIAAVGEPSIQPEMQGFGSLAEAITAGWYVFLTDAVTVDSTIVIDHSVAIDLQGHNVTGNGVRVFQVKNGTVEIDSTDADSGDVVSATISTIGSINPDSSVIRIGGGDASAAPELTIDEGVTVSSAVCYGITAFGVGTQTLVVDGTVATTGNRPAISGNGNASNGETTITINGTVSATAENAIYQPQAGTTTIKGTVTGGIEAKSGAVTIKSGAKVTARETTATHTANGDGCSTQGYAVAVVDNAGYKGGAVVTIEGGTITGPVAQVVDSEAKEANTLTITGGTFTVDPSAYVAEGYEATESEGVWTVSEKTGPKSWDEVKDDDVATIVTDLPEGKTVTATELAAWAKAKEVAFQVGITVPVNALIFYCAPDAIPTDVKAEADKALKQVAVDMDLLALMKEATEKGSVTIPAPDPNPYPLAVFKLVPATLGDGVVTSAELFKLSIELK